MSAGSDRVRVHVAGGVGRLTLARPEALNALDLGMIHTLMAALEGFLDDPGVRIVILDGEGERGLCAGGDVRSLYDQIVGGDPEATGVFFRAEYALNACIAEYPKPIVALADGITMGGGIGLAGHAAVRVVTERSRLAMPETRIGFTPDVGGTWLLGRAPGRLGEYLGLTGQAMDAADAICTGFADHFVPAARLDALAEALAASAATTAAEVHELITSDFAEEPGPSALEASRRWVDDAFQESSVSAIVARLRGRRAEQAGAAADALEQLSPTALTVTLAAVREARGLAGLRAALEQEYGLVMWFATTQPDLVEGIRAQLVDKDRDPHWKPATLAELPSGLAAAALAHRPAVALWG